MARHLARWELAGVGEPTYVITGRFEDRPDTSGDDDEMTASLMERARCGQPLEAAASPLAPPDDRS